MSVTVKRLSKSGIRAGCFDAIIREQLQIIDDELLHSSSSWGRNVVSHELPTVLGTSLKPADAQRIVYSAILHSLTKRGFEVRIKLTSGRSILYIAWVPDLDAEYIETMNAIIRKKRIDSAGLESFIKGEAPSSGVSASGVGAAEARHKKSGGVSKSGKFGRE